MSTNELRALLPLLRELHGKIRAGVSAAFSAAPVEELSAVAADDEGDTIYAIDKVSEALLVSELEVHAAALGGIVLVAEGITGGELCLPRGRGQADCAYRIIVDPIDGTRGLMYQKRPGWVLTGVARNRGSATRLSDIELAVQSELPLQKQYLADELWALRGQGAHAERVDLLSGARTPLVLRPSRSPGVEHGYASVVRFFPGARDVLAAIDDALMAEVLGAPRAGKALCFEDQYTSSGGQLYELMAGHDRFIADLRPLLAPLLALRGLPRPLCSHPYDLCTALIAQELGVLICGAWGEAFDAPLDIDADVAWVGYANAALRADLAPRLARLLERHGLDRAGT